MIKQPDQLEEEAEQKKDKEPRTERDATSLSRFNQQFNPQFNQQASKDFQRRQRYNKLLKLQYIKIFRKS